MVADTYSTDGIGVLLMGTGNDNNTWGANANSSVFQILVDAIANSLSSAVTGGTLDLSGSPPPTATSQAHYAGLIFTGVLGSNQSVKVPNLAKWWVVSNQTSGAFTLTFKTPSGSASTAIPQNSGWQIVYCDGSNNIVVWPFNTVQIQMPDGSAAAPAFSNINEPNSGWYRSASGIWKFSILGTAAVTVGASGIQFNDGTVGTPGITFASETTTSLYRIGAGDVGFAILVVKTYEVTASAFTWLNSTYAGSDLSPASFSTEQDNYNPANLASASCLRLNVTAACSLTGIQGGAAGRELELLNVGTATLQCPANSSSSSAANRFANTFNLVSGQSITLRYDATSSLWRPKNVATAFSSCCVGAVSGDLLIVNHSGTENTKIDITCSEVVMTDASGNAIKFENVSVTADSTTTISNATASGAGGCDTGTRSASTEYYLYIASDGVNVIGVFSTSATSFSLTNAPNFIYSKRVGYQRTDGSSNFVRIRQKGARAQYIVTPATNTTSMPQIDSGSSGSPTTPTWTTESLVGFIPSTAREGIFCIGQTTSPGSTGYTALAPNGNYGNVTSSTNPPPVIQTSNASAPNPIIPTFPAIIELESRNVFWTSNNSSGYLRVSGWIDSI